MRSKVVYFAQLAALVLASCAIAVLDGCAAIPGSERVPRAVAESVTVYCVQPIEVRRLFRAAVNRDLTAIGHSITINCAGDAPESPREGVLLHVPCSSVITAAGRGCEPAGREGGADSGPEAPDG